MSKDSSQLPLDFDSLSPLAASPMAEPHKVEGAPPNPHAPKTRRRFTNIAMISSGVFLLVAVTTWVMTTYVFVEKVADESSLESPETHMETLLAELPLVKVRYEGTAAAEEGQGFRYVSIVEIDASIIVQGTAGELLELESVMTLHQHRIEEAVDHTIRSAAPEDLDEPDGQTLRTRIRHRINEVYGTLVVKEVIFSHFRAFRTPIKTRTTERDGA